MAKAAGMLSVEMHGTRPILMRRKREKELGERTPMSVFSANQSRRAVNVAKTFLGKELIGEPETLGRA